MRKPTKSFTIEVKRRPTSLARKPGFAEMPAPIAEPAAAAAIFARVEAAPAAAEAERRILPCLVTEAAMDAAKAAVEAEPAIAPRRRGRPPKQRAADDLAPLAPRKRGRPRKNSIDASEPKPAVAPQAAASPRPAPRVVAAPVGASARSGARREAVSELPRGERWKRRLPKALR